MTRTLRSLLGGPAGSLMQRVQILVGGSLVRYLSMKFRSGAIPTRGNFAAVVPAHQLPFAVPYARYTATCVRVVARLVDT